MRKLRLLYICGDQGIPFGGTKGASIHVREFLEHLSANNWSPVVAMARIDKNSQYQPSFPVYALPSDVALPHDGDIEELGLDEQTIREAKHYYRSQEVQELVNGLHKQYDFDLIYERYSLFSTAGHLLSAKHGLPLVLEVNAPLVREAGSYRSLRQTHLARSVEKLLFNHASHIFAVSEELRSYILGISPNAVVSTTPNAVSLDRFTNVDFAAWRNRISRSPETDFVIGFVGSLKPWHGVEILLKAFAAIADTDSRLRLCLVGAGDQAYFNGLVELARQLGVTDRVVFTGAVAYEEVGPALLSMDALVAPYPALDNFYFSPLKVFEYMAAGKPIVASAIGQINNLLNHETTALLVPPGDQPALGSALLRLLYEPALRSRLAENALAEVTARHTWHQRVANAVGVFDALIRAKTKSRNETRATEVKTTNR
ncbi:MAG: glycosyltransferase family 4 protein [Candidatus Zixiibacteriota bacterium]